MGKIVYNGREYLSAGTASTMQGATSTTDGVSGLVPQPLIADRDKVLKGDGTWGDAAAVEANPSGTATDTLQKVDIDGVIYDIQGGGGSSGGMAAYTEVVLWHNDSGSLSPVNATLDDSLNNYDAIYVVQASEDTPTLRSSQIIPISSIDKSGNGYFGVYDTGGNSYYYSVLTYTDDTHLLLNSWGSNNKVKFYKVVGIKYGGNLSPIIYSTEEREVGVWIDNKPLYQKTYLFNALTNVPSGRWFDTGFTATDISIVGEAYGFYQDTTAGVAVPILASCDSGTNQPLYIHLARSASTEMHGFTIQYTKTTDVAGSGSYNTLGVPTVHYNDNEQVIGTWFEKPLYQKCYDNLNITVQDNSWSNLITISNGQDCIGLKVWGEFSEYFEMIPTSSHIDSTNGQLEARFVGLGADRIVKKLMVQYTKTTD